MKKTTNIFKEYLKSLIVYKIPSIKSTTNLNLATMNTCIWERIIKKSNIKLHEYCFV